MIVPIQLTLIELNGIQREDRFRKEGRTSHALTECAVASKGSHWRLIRAEPNLATKAAPFKYDGHDVQVPVGLRVRQGMYAGEGGGSIWSF